MKKLFALILLLVIGFWAIPGLADSTDSFAKTLRWVTAPVQDGLPSGCWFCPIYKQIFILMNDISYNIAYNYGNYFIALLSVGLFGCIVFIIGKAFLSFKDISMSDLLRSLAIPVGKAIIAYLLIQNINTIYYWVINPAIQLSTDMGTLLTQHTDSYAFSMVKGVAKVGYTRNIGDRAAFQEIQRTLDKKTTCESSITPLVMDPPQKMLFDNKTYTSIQCFMGSIGMSLSTGLAVGLAIMDWSFDSWLNRFKEIWIGLLVAAGYFMVMLMVGMKLIDPLIQLAVVSALMPAWIVLWVFPATAGYTKEAFKCLINVMGTIIILSIVVVIIIYIMGDALGGKSFDSVLSRMVVGAMSTRTFESFGWKQALWAFGYCMICFKLVGSIDGLVKTFAAGGQDMGAAKAIENLTIKLTHMTGALAQNATKLGATTVGGSLKYGKNKLFGRRAAAAAAEEAGGAGMHSSAPSVGMHHFGENENSNDTEATERTTVEHRFNRSRNQTTQNRSQSGVNTVVPESGSETPQQGGDQQHNVQDTVEPRWRQRQARARARQHGETTEQNTTPSAGTEQAPEQTRESSDSTQNNDNNSGA